MYVCSRHPRGLTAAEHASLLNSNPKAANWNWTRMQRDPTVYVCGRVWHPDHKTVVLNGWHRVLMNTENRAPGATAVVFLD